LNIMSFPALLIIWLAVLFAAYVGGWVAHIMDRRTQNLPGVSYHAPTESAHVGAKALRERGGRLVLLHRQRPVARMLGLLSADQMFTIVGETLGEPEADASAG
jgi:hypothetical protein